MALENVMAVRNGKVIGPPRADGTVTWGSNNFLGAKNLNRYPYIDNDGTNNGGIRYKVQDDGIIVLIYGTASQNCDIMCHARGYGDAYELILPNGKYIISGCPAGGGPSTYYIGCTVTKGGTSTRLGTDYGEGCVITVDGDDTYSDRASVGFFITVIDGTTVNMLTFKPMIRKAEDTDPTYVPWGAPNQFLSKYKVDWDSHAKVGAKNFGAGKFNTQVVNGVTFTRQNDWTVTAVATSVPTGGAAINSDSFVLKAGRYIYGENPLWKTGYSNISIMNASTGQHIANMPVGEFNKEKMFTLAADTEVYMRIWVAATDSAVNTRFKPMIRLADDPDDIYTKFAYTNTQLTDMVNYTTRSMTVDTTQGGGQVGYAKFGHIVVVTLTGISAKASSSILCTGFPPAISNIGNGNWHCVLHQGGGVPSGVTAVAYVTPGGLLRVEGPCNSMYGFLVYVTDEL